MNAEREADQTLRNATGGDESDQTLRNATGDESDQTLRNATGKSHGTGRTKAPPRETHRMRNLLFLALVAAFVLYLRPSTPDVHEVFLLQQPQTFELDNETVIRVHPSGRDVTVEWHAYDQESTSASARPYHVVHLMSGAEDYEISTQGCNRGQLVINERFYEFDAEDTQMLVRFGYGVMAEPGGQRELATRLDALP